LVDFRSFHELIWIVVDEALATHRSVQFHAGHDHLHILASILLRGLLSLQSFCKGSEHAASHADRVELFNRLCHWYNLQNRAKCLPLEVAIKSRHDHEFAGVCNRLDNEGEVSAEELGFVNADYICSLVRFRIQQVLS